MQRLRLLLAPHQPGCAPPSLQHLNPLRGPAGGTLAWEWVSRAELTWGGASRRGLSRDLALSQGSWSPETPTFWPQHPPGQWAEENWGAQGDVYGSPDRPPPPHPGTALPRREAGRRPGILQQVWGRAEEVTGCLGGGMRGGKTPGAVRPQEGARGLWSCLSTRWPRPL